MAKVVVSTLLVNDGCMFRGPGDMQDEAYVATVIDPVNQIFTGLRVSGKTPITWLPTDLVTKIDIPGVGPILLAL